VKNQFYGDSPLEVVFFK